MLVEVSAVKRKLLLTAVLTAPNPNDMSDPNAAILTESTLPSLSPTTPEIQSIVLLGILLLAASVPIVLLAKKQDV
jgi:hypothetical protein